MLSRRLAGTAAICLLLAAGTTACNDTNDPSGDQAVASAPKLDTDKLSAQEIAKQSEDALASATSLKVATTSVLKGGNGRAVTEIMMDVKGQCIARATVPDSGQMEIVSDGKTNYLKPTAAMFVTAGDPKAKAKFDAVLKGRYLTGFESDEQLKSLVKGCTISEIANSFVENVQKSGIEKGSAGTVNGAKTFSLKATDDKGEQSTINVAGEGKPYPVRIEEASGKDTIDYGDYDKPFTVTVPPADQTMDFAKFKALLNAS